jgi:hypothetical protein
MRSDESFLTDIVHNTDLLMHFVAGITRAASG